MWPFRTKAAARVAVKYANVVVGMGRARWLSQSYRTLATEGFQQNPVVYSCVSKLARAAASVDLHLYRHNRWGDLEKFDRHPILDLVDRPNPAWSGRQFLEKAATHYLIGGNAYVLGNNGERAPTELWLLPPDYVTVDAAGGRLLPQSYTYKPGTGETEVPG